MSCRVTSEVRDRPAVGATVFDLVSVIVTLLLTRQLTTAQILVAVSRSVSYMRLSTF